jgi:hypothetical protein
LTYAQDENHLHGTTMVYIIADDLTGATDTGVQFAKQGYKTHVVIVSKASSRSLADSGRLSENVDVLALDTETRETDKETARMRISSVLKGMSLRDDDLVYKKVDSTLRGNIGIELEESLNVLNKDGCLFTPSFPPTQRITVESTMDIMYSSILTPCISINLSLKIFFSRMVSIFGVSGSRSEIFWENLWLRLSRRRLSII